MTREIEKNKVTHKIHQPKKKPLDPRENPRPGYDEKNPTKRDIQDHPEDQNTG